MQYSKSLVLLVRQIISNSETDSAYDLLTAVRIVLHVENASSFRLVVSLVYYGLALGSSSLAGSPFINLAIAGLVELPGGLFVYLTIERFGRRVILTGCMAMSGVACLLIPAIPTGE